MKVIDLSERQRQILTYMDAGVEYSTEQVAENRFKSILGQGSY